MLKTIPLLVISTVLFCCGPNGHSQTNETTGSIPNVINYLLLDGGGSMPPVSGSATISGERKRWHRVTLDITGPESGEDDAVNPFTQFRMDVTFTKGAKSYVVPGYFAADGNAGETSATSGGVWRTHFSPDETGTWQYRYSFVTGNNVSVNGGGTPVFPMHGTAGSFVVSETDKAGRDFRAHGRLAYVGERYLQHLGSGEYFIKIGADAPEGLLGYADFDGTSNQNGGNNLIKTFSDHVADWNNGDPSWQNGKGRGLVGA